MSILDNPRLDIPRIPVSMQRAFRDAAAAELQEQLQTQIQVQSWYRKYANTISGTASTVAGGIGIILLYGERLPLWAFVALIILGIIANAFILKSTKNGITESTVSKIDVPFVAEQMAESLAIPFQRALVEAREAIPEDAQRQIDTLADQAAKYHVQIKEMQASIPQQINEWVAAPVTHERG